MGSCISKCSRPKKCYIEDFSHVQDKLVISSSQITPRTPIPVSNKISPLPLSPSIISSSSSVSSFTCTTSNTATSSCSSLSSSASVLSSKDRSFSNEFLWACVKENPHVIRINSIKEASSLALASAKSPTQISESPVKPVVAKVKQAIQQREKGSTPQKRGRSSSPSPLTRQKSFRKEPDRLNSAYYLPSRSSRSPSPSRRFNGDNHNRGILASTSKEICSSKRIVGPKVNALNSISNSSLRKENFRPSSPMLSSHISSTPLKSCLRNRETFIHRISSKLDESAVRAAYSSHQENDSINMEDIDNPFISLDCFIFL